MAQISFDELVEIIRRHPDYRRRWEAGVGAERALYISFSQAPVEMPVESKTFDGADGSLIVLDRDSHGRVRGIEIT